MKSMEYVLPLFRIVQEQSAFFAPRCVNFKSDLLQQCLQRHSFFFLFISLSPLRPPLPMEIGVRWSLRCIFVIRATLLLERTNHLHEKWFLWMGSVSGTCGSAFVPSRRDLWEGEGIRRVKINISIFNCGIPMQWEKVFWGVFSCLRV